MFCIKCGKTLEPSAGVCPDCGTKVVLPEGFIPESENIVTIDVDMLTGEKTVAADHEAIARKAAAASAKPAPVAKPEEPKLSTGFDLNGAKKIMNGRSILIDDSPAAPPVFSVPPVQSPEKKSGKNTVAIIIAAVAVIAAALIAIFFISSKNKNDDNKKADSDSDKTTVETTQSETLPLIGEVTEEFSATELAEETTVPDNALTEKLTEPSTKINRPILPSDKNDEEAQTDIAEVTSDVSQEKEEVTADVSAPLSNIGSSSEAPEQIVIPTLPEISIE